MYRTISQTLVSVSPKGVSHLLADHLQSKSIHRLKFKFYFHIHIWGTYPAPRGLIQYRFQLSGLSIEL